VFEFDPDRVAAIETAGWRAYYDRNWARVVQLIAKLNHEQFHMPFPLSYVGAVHIARASLAWAPVEHDLTAVQTHLVRYYRMARRSSGLRFDPHRAARRELAYWIEHRRLVDNPDKAAFVEAMTALHSELFSLPLEQMLESAEWRVAPNNTVDLITSGRTSSVEVEWQRIEGQLARCYRSIYRAVNGRDAAPSLEPSHADYQFVTNWRIAAPVDQVWDVLSRPEDWPRWWSGLEQVDVIAPGDADGVGAVRGFVFRGRLPYRLRFFMRQSRQERPLLLEGTASGELAGTGRWTLVPIGAETAVRYNWDVSTTRPWMKLLAPLARPAFVWNHDWVMRQGETGLKQLLEASPSRSAR